MGAWRLDADLGWQAQAACRNTGATAPVQQEQADRYFAAHRPSTAIVQACGACPVREACLKWALDHDEAGYWGGVSETERRKMKRAAS